MQRRGRSAPIMSKAGTRYAGVRPAEGRKARRNAEARCVVAGNTLARVGSGEAGNTAVLNNQARMSCPPV